MAAKFLFAFVVVTCYPHARVPLYTLCSPEYQPLIDQYLLPNLAQDNFEPHIIKEPIPKNTGTGWTPARARKIKIIIDAIKQTWGNFFVFVDADTIFLKPAAAHLTKTIVGLDMLIQTEKIEFGICTGIVVVRSNTAMLDFWTQVAEYAQKLNIDDEQAIRDLLANGVHFNWNVLSSNQFVCGSKVTKGEYYISGMELALPPTALFFHANSCMTVPMKNAFLAAIVKKLHS